MFVGIFVLLLGILMLLERAGFINGGFGDYLLPVVIIAFGASMIFDKKEKC